MSQNLYQLLLRHPHLLDQNTLIVGAAADLPGAWSSLVKSQEVQVLTWDWQTAQAYRPLSEPQVQFALPDENHFAQAQRVIVLWPKSKALALALLQKIAALGKECWVVGANDAGGKSIHKAAHTLISTANKVDSARHCSLWQLSLHPAEDFNWLSLAQSFHHLDHAYLSLPGVFNHGKLDLGSALLLEYLPAPRAGKLLDLGCGSGVIGLSMKAREPSLQVTLSDVDAFALQSARLNAVRLGLQAEVLASDGLAEITSQFDYIVTNPPFHQGKETNYQFARELFARAKQHLVADGQLWLVANRHLPYESWASEYFSQVEVMAQEKGFKIIKVA